MNILFFLVHPAKFHFHRIQINELISRGHKVEILITSKDVLEDLVIEEGWEYVNLFPKGRKIPNVHRYIGAIINLVRTVYKLWRYTRGKKYDLFIGDLLTILGRLKGIPSLFPTDDVLAAVPEGVIYAATSNYIIAPKITDLNRYNKKKIGYDGYKALAHLHPNHFKPDRNCLQENLRKDTPFFLIRCVSFKATHDLNKTGINNEILEKLVHMLKGRGEIIISSERALPDELEKYRLKAKKRDISHYLYYATLFIGDSTTMAAEAAVLGTPSIEFDDYFEEIDQMLELEKKYGLTFGIRTSAPNMLYDKVEELLDIPDLKEEFRKRSKRLIADKIDVSALLIWLFENFPKSISILKKDPDYQYHFS